LPSARKLIPELPVSNVNKNIGYMLLAQVGKFVVPLVTFPYLTRVLGLEQYGVLATGLAISMYIWLLTQFGFSMSAVEHITKNINDSKALSKVFTSVMVSQLTLFFVSCVAVWSGLQFFNIDPSSQLVIMCYMPLVLGNMLLVEWLHQGLERMSSVAFFIMLGRIVSIPLTFVFVDSSEDTWIAALVHSAGIIVAGILSTGYGVYKSNIDRFDFDWGETKSLLRQSFPIFMTHASGNLYNMSMPILIGAAHSAATAGLYNTAHIFKNIAVQLTQAIFQSIYPRSIRYFNEDRVEMRKFLRKYGLVTMLLGVLGVVVTVTISPWLVVFAAGEDFAPAAPVLQILIFAVLFSMANNFLGIQILLPYGYKKEFSQVVVVSGMSSVMVMYFFTQWYGAEGLASAIVLTEFMIMLSLLRLHRKYRIVIFYPEKFL
jgi:O-antigen/teichoic acid export membrane protein